MLKILAISLLVICGIAAIAAGWVISLALLAFSLIFLFICLCIRAASEAQFAIFGKGKLVNVVMDKYIPFVSERSDLLKRYFKENNLLITKLNLKISKKSFEQCEEAHLTEDLDSWALVKNNFTSVEPHPFFVFFLQKKLTVDKNTLIASFADYVANLISSRFILSLYILKEHLQNKDDDETWYDVEDNLDQIITMLRILAYSVLLQIDYPQCLKQTFEVLKHHEENRWYRDLYIDRYNKLVESIEQNNLTLTATVGTAILSYNEHLKTFDSNDIEQNSVDIADNFLKENSLYTTVNILLTDLHSIELEGQFILHILKH